MSQLVSAAMEGVGKEKEKRLGTMLYLHNYFLIKVSIYLIWWDREIIQIMCFHKQHTLSFCISLVSGGILVCPKQFQVCQNMQNFTCPAFGKTVDFQCIVILR